MSNRTKIIDEGFFAGKFDAYVITTPSKKFQVERKQIEFHDLRKILVRLHPGFVVPALPKRPLKKLDRECMEKRRQKLQTFLNEVLRHQLLRTSKFFMTFISAVDQKEYDETKKKYEKAVYPADVSFFYTIDGKANTAVTPKLEQNCSDISTGMKKLRDEYKK